MAKYATDFSGNTIGAIPAGWSKRWDALDAPPKVTYTVQAVSAGGSPGGSLGGIVLRCDAAAGDGRSAITANALDGATDIEILARVRVTATANNFGVGLLARGVEDGGGFDGYYITINEASGSNDFALVKVVNGTPTTVSQVTVSGGITLNAWYWLRFKVSGTSLQARIWKADGTSEPGTWNINTTDSALSAGGFAGVFHRTPSSGQVDAEVDWFSAGTAGDTPPSPGAGDLLLNYRVN